ncbi:MAG TPA: dihydrolipoyl dehydrogenase [Candidatus Limnocylindria bacterium]|jgi:dihydrolipoamide dehydrogenase|nr:dihydrolipoyl dehydrogenase [Candidatus Limnocylindria bacterium]
MSAFDVVVIGGGPGGYVAAIRAAQLGFKTACIEKEPALGGTCLRVGCIPSKALLESSEKWVETRQILARHGVMVSDPKLDLTATLKRKSDIVTMLTKGVDGLLRKNKVTRFAGHGRLNGPGVVEVTTEAGVEKLEARHIILATGSKSASLPGIRLDGEYVGTSTEALSYSSVPGRLVVIGAGYIGLELGSVWARLGSQVTVVEYLDRILPGMDREMADEAQKLFAKQGLVFRLGHKVLSASGDQNGCAVQCEGQEPILADRVLVAVGRVPNTDNLGLDTVGLTLDPRGRIPVDEHLCTPVAGIYAIGDVIRGPMLAHKAEEEGVAAVDHIAGKAAHVNYEAIPGVCYTHPEIASVGQTEEQLVQAKVEYRKGSFPFRANGRALALGDTEGRVKILADAKTDRVLGVHILGPRAGDLIAEAVAAINFHASAEDLFLTSHAHPTLAEAIKEAAMAVHGRAIHI